jgi:ATP-dependent Clp protease ATP-binding subunit ClpA
MLERFTERARQVVVFAQDEARALEHDYIGTEHLLLGLLREPEGRAGRILASLGIALDDVRVQVGRIAGTGRGASPSQLPFTPRAKRVLELALREAMALEHDYIGTEHILLGLLRENEGVAARILYDFDAGVRTHVLRALGKDEQPAAQRGEPPPVADRPTFTAGAERVLELAHDEACGLKHDYIGTEHILLGLLREEQGIAARALASLGIGLATVRTQVGRIVGEGDEVTTGQIPLTPRVENGLGLARREARSMGGEAIDTEHILLGLAHEGEGIASHILRNARIDEERVRSTVFGLLSGSRGDET